MQDLLEEDLLEDASLTSNLRSAIYMGNARRVSTPENTRRAADTATSTTPCSTASNCVVECRICGGGSRIVNGQCVPCPDPRMTATVGSCTCTAEYTTVGDNCLHRQTTAAITAQYPSPQAYEVTYPDVESAAGAFQETVQSYTLQEYLFSAASRCQRDEGVQYCQQLHNLCTLQLYQDDAAACGLFETVTRGPFGTDTHGYDGWLATVGFKDAPNSLSAQNVDSKFAYTPTSGFQTHLNITLAKYSMDGEFLGMEPLTTQLELCGGGYNHLTRWLKFGVEVLVECELRVAQWLYQNLTTYFYEPYYVDSKGSYVAMPVLVKNIRRDGTEVNFGVDVRNVMRRRFFLYDFLSGVTSAGARPDVIRILSKAEIMLQSSVESRIEPPILAVKYAEIDVTNLQFQDDYSTESEFSTFYEGESTKFGDRFTLLLITSISLGAIFMIYRMYRILQLNGLGELNLDCSTLLEFLMTASYAIANVFGWTAIGFAFYWYMFYKWGGVVDLLLPHKQKKWDTFVDVIIAMQFISMGYLIRKQAHTLVFFIDWEAPKGKIFSGASGSGQQIPVSTWRVLFVANEFCKLQTKRVINLEFTCLWVLALYEGWRLQYAACQNPDGSDLHNCIADGRTLQGTAIRDGSLNNQLLRLAVIAFLWMSVTLFQWLWQRLCNDRTQLLPKTQINTRNTAQLVDLMSLTNVSVFILCEKFYGFYIHGETNIQGGSSDTDLEKVMEQLDHERNRMSVKRGLGRPNAENRPRTGDELENTSTDAEIDIQTHIMVLGRNRGGGGQTDDPDAGVGAMQMEGDLLQQNESLHDFWTSSNGAEGWCNCFRWYNQVPQGGPGDAYKRYTGFNKLLKHKINRVRKSISSTTPWIGTVDMWDRTIRFPRNADTPAEVFLKRDPYSLWTDIFYEGIEPQLCLFDIYMFYMWMLFLDNASLAMLCTYLTQKTYDFIRHEEGMRCMFRSSMLSEQFGL